MKDSSARNVLFVVLDTVRASDTYLSGDDITPALDDVAESGADFKRAITTAPWTLSAHASMYTGKYPAEHGAIHSNRWLDDDNSVLAEELRDAGFRTGLFTANAFLAEGFNLDRGFEEASFVQNRSYKLFDEGLDPVEFTMNREHRAGVPRFLEIADALRKGPTHKNVANALYFKLRDAYQHHLGRSEEATWDDTTVEDAGEFIRRNAEKNRKFFCFVNLVDAHAPWQFDRELLKEIDVVPEEIAPESRWEWVAEHSEAQWPYAAGEVEFDETDRCILHQLYRAHIAKVDSVAGDLLDSLREAGVDDETLVILTSDHGELLAENGVLGHSVVVDEDVAHVPMVVDGPRVPSTTVREPISVKDIYGTVLARTGLEEDARTIFDDDAQGVALIETAGMDPSKVDGRYRTIATEYGPRYALYTSDGRAEYRERTDEWFGDHDVRDQLEALREKGDIASKANSRRDEIDEAVEDRLRELGYRG